MNDDDETGNAAKMREAARKCLTQLVSIGESVTPHYLVCLEDGRRMAMLTRHLRKVHGLSPGQYRAKWDLPPDYPMVAPGHMLGADTPARTRRIHTAVSEEKGGEVVWLRPRGVRGGGCGDDEGQV